MTNWHKTYHSNREKLIAANAYSPDQEHDSCGVGLVVAIDGKPRREIVEMGINALKNVWHRGAVAADGKTGDGAGISLDVPQEFFQEQVRNIGHVPSESPICIGHIFLPRIDHIQQETARSIVETEIMHFGFYIYGWRQTPVDVSVIGQRAADTRPQIEQIMFRDERNRSDEELERALYICRRRIERMAREEGILDIYVCSLSQKSIVYKGMFLAQDIDEFYLDLKNDNFTSSVAIYHQRYSTNTFPQWSLAQPFRMLAHNGEINTLRGNINWMKSHEIKMVSGSFGDHQEDIKPVISNGLSDSAALDSVFELLVRAGRNAPMAKALLIPEAWSKRASIIPDKNSALYAYCNSVMEPWDGPAAICAFDGRWAIAGLDRNGLRPLRYALTSDGILTVGSEAGMCPLGDHKVKRKGHVQAGGLIAVDIEENRFYEHDEIIDQLASQHPYVEWLKNVKDLEPLIGPGTEPRLFNTEELVRRQFAAGFTMEQIELILSSMAETGKEAIGSMGDDTALAVLSESYRPLSHYFKQNFSQVTNPPIDPLREDRVMSLITRFKNLGNILTTDVTQQNVFVLDSPILSTGMYDRLIKMLGERVTKIDCLFEASESSQDDGSTLQRALQSIQMQAEEAVRAGQEHLILTDENQNLDQAAIPMILATGAVHSHLVKQGLRAYCSITVRSGECIDTHYHAVLVGVGATCVNAYLAQETIAYRFERGLYGDLTLSQCIINFNKAIEAGLLKILSKMGISVVSSYRGGYNFEALGLSRALVADYLPGMTSRVSGIGLAGLESLTRRQHRKAFEESFIALPVGGFYRLRTGAERHALDGELIHLLQEACASGDYKTFERYAEKVNNRKPVQLRDLLTLKPGRESISLDRVQSINEIRKRFVTPGMSLGALSPEAHGTLNVAMNRIGAKSVSGEGGEDKARYKPLPNGDNMNSAVKQIASGRFGVTAEYLNQCREIEIKVAQGAKPGEGGQLPGFKVTDLIAKLRHSTPGVTLISPPPHHDIYSIEDLAQLIYDLKQINPIARVCVKLVAQSGVGTVAAGVAKAKADVILIAGGVGGTGASPQTSIKYAGLPWELGLSEAHQILTLNDLRDKVTLRTDGGLRTGHDIVIAAMLGAEEYGIGTASLVAMGCIMVRQCHSNICPVGVCTQDETLRKKFTGTADKVVNLMSFVAEDVRRVLASVGLETLDEAIGRTDLLAQVSRGSAHLDDLDLNSILVNVNSGTPIKYTPQHRQEVPDTLDAQILRDAEVFFERGEKIQLQYNVKNTQRAIGARSSSEMVRRFGGSELSTDRLHIRLEGSAGQSLGAFSVQGLKLEVIGDTNDYAGKGLSGATIIVKPDRHMEGDDNTIIGNTCLYGATSGYLFAAGHAGVRFAVRNSGANAVIEGCGANGCEYMTGGTVAVIGPVGDNFGAGMTGGLAFVWDPNKLFESIANPDSIGWYSGGDLPDELVESYRSLIEQHRDYTGSLRAQNLLENWERTLSESLAIVPKEVASMVFSNELKMAG